MAKKQITIQDIAKAADVSKTTVSRYLNGKFEYMSEETRKRISDTIEETGYRPNRMANSLKTNQTGLIGIIMSNVMSSQTPMLLGSICDICAQYGKKVIVVNSEKNPEKERDLVYDLLAQRVDGLIVLSGYNYDFYRNLDQEELPVVIADRVPGNSDMDSVAINHIEGTKKVINHLINQGYEQIVLLKQPHKNPNNTPRLREKSAFDTCRERFGDDTHFSVFSIDLRKINENACEAFSELANILIECHEMSKKTPTAVFVAEASIMNAVACNYYRAELKISKSFTIAGYCEWNMACQITPQISTIEQPLAKLGQLATEKLINRIDQRRCNQGDKIKESSLLNCKINLSEL